MAMNLLGDNKTSTTKSSSSNSLLEFLKPDDSWIPKGKLRNPIQKEAVSMYDTDEYKADPRAAWRAQAAKEADSSWNKTEEGFLNKPKGIDGAMQNNPMNPNNVQTLKGTPKGVLGSSEETDVGVEGIEGQGDKDPRSLDTLRETHGSLTNAVATATGQDPQELSDSVTKEVETPQSSVEAAKQVVAEAQKGEGYKVGSGVKLDPQVEKFMAERPKEWWDKFTDVEFWEGLPGVDRVDWMTTLAIAGTSLALGNTPGLAMANGLLRGLESQDKKEAYGLKRDAAAEVAGNKEAGLDRRAMEANQSRERAANKGINRAAMSTDEVTQSLKKNFSTWGGFGGGDIDEASALALAPKMAQLQTQNPAFANIDIKRQYYIAKALEDGDSELAGTLYKEATGG